MPKYSNIRPDFQAPGPRVLIDKAIKFEEEELDEDTRDEIDDLLTFKKPKVRYYESQKVLGKMYRSIDEHKFFEEIQRQSRPSSGHRNPPRSLVDTVWKYVEQQTTLIQWKHYMGMARDIRDA